MYPCLVCRGDRVGCTNHCTPRELPLRLHGSCVVSLPHRGRAWCSNNAGSVTRSAAAAIRGCARPTARRGHGGDIGASMGCAVLRAALGFGSIMVVAPAAAFEGASCADASWDLRRSTASFNAPTVVLLRVVEQPGKGGWIHNLPLKRAHAASLDHPKRFLETSTTLPRSLHPVLLVLEHARV